MAAAAEWALSPEQRADTVDRVAKNISAMAFFRGQPIPDGDVQAAAEAVEKKAYTVARVEARTHHRHEVRGLLGRRGRLAASRRRRLRRCLRRDAASPRQPPRIAGRTTRRSRLTCAS